MIMRCKWNDNYFAESQNFEIPTDQINTNSCLFLLLHGSKLLSYFNCVN